jgi:type II secretory pathway pseudopilin PulG
MMRHGQRGITLIEVVIATVIIAAVGGTIVGVLSTMARNSAASMTQAQSTSIANAYLQEILSRSFTCTGAPILRRDFNCVAHYNGIDEAPTDRFGNPVPNLGNYRVRVSVVQSAIGPIPAADVRRVTVTVNDPFGGATVLGGIKTNHP